MATRQTRAAHATPEIAWLGRKDYDPMLQVMEAHRERLIAGDESAARVMLLEHPPVITLGRHARPENVVLSETELQRRGILVRKVARGGDVTYHGPGQLMVYPVLQIGLGITRFLEDMAECLAAVAATFGASKATWRPDPAGLWVNDRKLAACGLHLRKGVCIHGFAFNVATPPEAWHSIVPCGLVGSDAPISLAELVGTRAAPTVEEFAQRAIPFLRELLD